MYQIHTQASVLQAKIPCRGFILWYVASAHSPLKPRAPLSSIFTLCISRALLEFIALQALTRSEDQLLESCQKGKVLPNAQHWAVPQDGLKSSSRRCPQPALGATSRS